MGPVALFDKSFLQSLSVDEAVWFDHHFLPNICPLFYVETLADLDKSVRSGRTPEQEVGLMATKFPQMQGSPSAYHVDMCIANLMGQPVPMDGRIPMTGGRLVKSGGKSGVIFEQSSAAQAFSRWSNGEFLEIERQYARLWREALSNLDLESVGKTFREIGIDGKSCTSLEEVYQIASAVVNGKDKPFDRMKLAVLFFSIPRQLHSPLLERWKISGYQPISEYAPYAAYVLTVEIFFQLAIASHHIASTRPSNRADIAYLFYLPFCAMFVSWDKLHRKCAPLFLRQDQDFVWGPDLKNALSELNTYYAGLPQAERDRGIMAFAASPPTQGDTLVTMLWDKHLPAWRRRATVPSKGVMRDSKLADEVASMAHAHSLSAEEVDFDPQEPDSMTLQRSIQMRRGSWWQLPKNFKPNG